ncbi:N-acetylglucosamine-1-phosphotransferase subunits alpha/beta isoform X2 [Cylas formicarius]|nr:N-acetylglucosamine-1-phosphotransferase subunits alpha/beta isoform X2 [Cylas formicarius]
MHFYHKLQDSNVDSSKKRYEDKNELRFSLRSLEKNAPWVNHIYIVTNGQIPHWLDLNSGKVSIVTHNQIFKDTSNLPTFSSPAIESNLHRIPGLSDKFIYFNDDIFLGLPTYPEDFYISNKGYLIYLAWVVPQCNPNCPWMYVNDGQCDKACNNVNCQFDGEDCVHNMGQFPIVSYEDSSFVDMEKQKLNEFEEFKKKVQQLFDKKVYGSIPRKQYQSEHNKTDKVALIKNLTNIINEHNNQVMRKNKVQNRKQRSVREKLSGGSGSFNIDAYSESLQYTNRLFNKKYGFKVRKVPAHAPILIEKEIMAKLQATFPTEFALTERNRFRRANDMQFSFSYYYFLMSEKIQKTSGEIFDDVDTDGSGTWSDREIRNVLTKMYELPLSYEIVDGFEAILINCSERQTFNILSTPPYERYIDSKLPTITRDMVVECSHLSQILRTKFGSVPKYKYEIIKSSENGHVTFRMLRSNITDVVIQLDEIREELKKFICLNDNLDETKSAENEVIRAILYDFYLSLFPNPSNFELPEESRNRFLYMDELNDWKTHHYRVKVLLCLTICFLIFAMFFGLLKKSCCVLFNKIFC